MILIKLKINNFKCVQTMIRKHSLFRIEFVLLCVFSIKRGTRRINQLRLLDQLSSVVRLLRQRTEHSLPTKDVHSKKNKC